jgi:hypothetical protein
VAQPEEADQPAEEEGQPANLQAPHVPNLIVAIEEPELYQHPTKQRHFSAVLRGLSKGALPGAEGPTQIIFGSHSPMFVSLGHANEVRLVRRVDCDDSDYKQCHQKALSLTDVAHALAAAWQKPEADYTAESLAPRLHILGTELAEGFFANGVVLVEGRSDKAALSAVARMLGVNFEAEGIAVLSAEGKTNLDRPALIFRELGIPVFLIWDCDGGKKEKDRMIPHNLALMRIAHPEANVTEAPTGDVVGDNFAHFSDTLESKLHEELTDDIYTECLGQACDPYGIPPSNETTKIPDIMFGMLKLARDKGHSSPMLEELVRAIWRHLCGQEIPQAGAPADEAVAA